ncbi:unnamed protein product [Zymoseptoria tritici ST99CH_3D1]|nr:unnamed protein product [Zymoseptoria tritici ST99CH_3D1]
MKLSTFLYVAAFFTGQALAAPNPFAEAEAEAMPIYDPEPNTRCEVWCGGELGCACSGYECKNNGCVKNIP